MDLSLILLIGGIVAILLGFIFCFFGYKLARFLIPLCGLLVLEAIITIFGYNLLTLNEISTWLFFGGSSVAIYLLLFFIKRVAGFFTGLLGSAFMLLYIVYALNLHGFTYLYPICFTVCVISGFITVAYNKVGVILFTSMFGASVTAFIGLYIFFEGTDPAQITQYGNVLIPLEQFLIDKAYMIAGASLGVTIIGGLIQTFKTSNKQVLCGYWDENDSFKVQRTEKPDYTQTDTWLADDIETMSDGLQSSDDSL